MPADPSSRPIGGLSIEQFAGVGAAIGMGLPLAEVLEQEQIAPAQWSAGDKAWKESLAESPDLQILYQRARHLAEDCLARTISPIDEDPRAWLGLLGALATRDDADGLLTGLGLTMVDVGCVGRAWSRRARRDPALARQIQELAADSSPPERVVAAPVALRPFPWTPARLENLSNAGTTPGETQAVASAIEARPGLQRASYQLAEAEGSAVAPRDADGPGVADITLPPASTFSSALPFDQRSSGLPLSRPPLPPAEQSGHTIAALPQAGGAQSLPFDGGGAVGMLVLQRYAAMAAEIRRDLGKADEVMSRWGLESTEQRQRIHGLWELRFRMNPALRAQFEQVVRDLLSREDPPLDPPAIAPEAAPDPDSTVPSVD